MADVFDYIIVAGWAGCACAERLSANPRRSGPLIEAGAQLGGQHIVAGGAACGCEPQ